MTYYTLRKAGIPEKPTYELSKWEDGETHPTNVYVQWTPQKGDGSFDVQSCNCPSRSNPCKHVAIALALLEKGVDWLCSYYWEDGEVKHVDDGLDFETYQSFMKGIHP